MKKILVKILMLVVLAGIFLLPIQPSIELNSDHSIKEIVLNSSVSRAVDPSVDRDLPKGLDLNCGISGLWGGDGSLTGCIAVVFWAIFQVVAWITSLAGQFLDFFIYYSTNSASYVHDFVKLGWAAIRDIANIFFIVALLYVSIKIILSLDEGHSKKLIGTIVIVALLLNFSLFFSRVIIDASNVLAKVFYNNIDQKYENNNPANGAEGEKSISVGLMRLFDPEKILDQKTYNASGGPVMFIIITVILILMLLYTAYIFFSVGILFVSRVVMLWFCMIFAPIAFASYTLPFDIPGLGHKEWWGQLLKNAFLAPIFTFMLYIIVMFAGFLRTIAIYPDGASLMQKIMGVIIPFVLLVVLLMKAKEMAVTYSGEMGKAMVKAGSMAGGAALGLGAGALAFGGRQVVGNWVGKMATSTKLANLETQGFKLGSFGKYTGLNKLGKVMGTGLRNVGTEAKKGSFDVRGIKVGGKNLASTGLMVGTAGGVGGYEKAKADKIQKREKRAEDLKKVVDKGKLGKELRKTEEDLQKITNLTKNEIEDIDNKLTFARQRLTDAKNRDDKTGITDFGKQVEDLEAEKKMIKNEGIKYVYEKDENGNSVRKTTGETRQVQKEVDEEVDETTEEVGTGVRKPTGRKIKTGRKITVTENVDVYETAQVKVNGKTFNQLTGDVKAQKREIEKEKNNLASSYADKITRKKLSNFFGLANAANKEAAHNIKMGIKTETK